MTDRKIYHVSAQEGYDRWSKTYDRTPNPVVAMDERHTARLLAASPAERILDAGCGTGRHFRPMLQAGSLPYGLDFSYGMLQIARHRFPHIPLALADLQRSWPIRDESFDTVLCALVGEHLGDLRAAFSQMHDVLKPGGRLLFSVYHPEMAAAGIEANFEADGAEFRLGAFQHTTQDYVDSLRASGFAHIQHHSFRGDDELVSAIPEARKYLGFPILLIIKAVKGVG